MLSESRPLGSTSKDSCPNLDWAMLDSNCVFPGLSEGSRGGVRGTVSRQSTERGTSAEGTREMIRGLHLFHLNCQLVVRESCRWGSNTAHSPRELGHTCRCSERRSRLEPQMKEEDARSEVEAMRKQRKNEKDRASETSHSKRERGAISKRTLFLHFLASEIVGLLCG